MGEPVTFWRNAINLNDLRKTVGRLAAHGIREPVTFWRKSCVRNKQRPVGFFLREGMQTGWNEFLFRCKGAFHERYATLQ
jgi:hypothetical protein